MKRLINTLLAVGVLLTAWPAKAQEADMRGEHAVQAGEGDRSRPPARPAVWPPEGRGGRHGDARMSPEERQQLRRDINAHGREIYRERRRRR